MQQQHPLKLFLLKQILALAISLTITIAISPDAHAYVERQDNRCVAHTVQQVHSHLINYSQYRSIDDRLIYRIEVAGREFAFPLINMTRSDAVFRAMPQGSRDTDALIWIVLQPYSLSRPGDQELLPRFYLHCRSQWDISGDGFTHNCAWVHPPYVGSEQATSNSIFQEFGLTLQNPLFTTFGVGSRTVPQEHLGFHSQLRVDTSGCPEGQSRLNYSFQIEPNREDIYRVKEAVMSRFMAQILGRFTGIPGISELARAVAERQVAPLFDETNQNNFYGWYYAGFYNEWANSIR